MAAFVLVEGVADAAVVAVARGGDFVALFNFSERPLVVALETLGMGAWPGQGNEARLAPCGMRWLRR